MKINGKTYLSSRGYGILKESNPDILQALKDALTVSPKTFSVLGNEKPIQFPVYRENDKKLYLPKNYGLQKCGKPSEVNIPDGEDCPRLVFNGSIRKEQEEPVQCYLEAIADPLRMGGIISLPCGYGKCLAKDTPVLLYNGAIKLSQDITVNDILMGDDSKPRMVLSTCCGKELLYDVIPLIGESYTVNESHILSLRHCKSNKIEDIPLKKFIKLPIQKQQEYVSYRARIEFQKQDIPIHPYKLGTTLFNFEKLPDYCKYNSISIRTEILKGLMDEYGFMQGKDVFIPIFERPALKEDLLFLIRSLGYVAVVDVHFIYMINDLDYKVPIEVKPYRYDMYYGFVIDGNHRFVLGDFTVTHNTVISLYIASLIKKKTLVICHKDFLGNQWRERIEYFLPTAKIGQIKQNKIDIDDKDIVIGSLQSIAMKEYDGKIFEDFGLVICDECHHLSAEVFSQCLPKITCKRMLGLSATLKRKDGLSKVFEWFLGKPVYTIKREDNQLNVLIKKYYDPHEEYGREHKLWNGKLNVAKMINKICEFAPRNYMIVQTLLEILKKEPLRQVLILSERRNHLTLIEDLLKLYNIDSIGYYIGGMKQEELDKSATKQFILGTFQLASEGMDIPTLNTLILASPVSSIEQAIGRIQRQKANERKYIPLVIDIWDEFSIFDGQGRKRNKFYTQNNYAIQDSSIQVEPDKKYQFIIDPDEK